MPTPQESAHRTPAAADNDLIDGEKDDDGVNGVDEGEDDHGHVGRGDGGFGADHVGLRGRGDTRRAMRRPRAVVFERRAPMYM